jgi:predicted nucleic acid-binding Zn ribbon protein
VSRWRPLSEPGGGDPRPLRDSLARYRTALSAVVEHWAAAVGSDIACHARPVAVRGGALVIEADDPAWASQLKWLGNDLLARLAEATGGPVADRVDVRVAPR